MALISGISEAKILEVKQTEIHDKASKSIKSKGWLPICSVGLDKGKRFSSKPYSGKRYALPKPTLDIDMRRVPPYAKPDDKSTG